MWLISREVQWHSEVGGDIQILPLKCYFLQTAALIFGIVEKYLLRYIIKKYFYVTFL